MTRAEVRTVLGGSISHTTFWRWQKQGLLHPVRIGRLVRYRASEIERLVNSLQVEDAG